MKGLKEFIEDLGKDKKLAEKFKDITDPEKVVKVAKKEGYEFTEDDYMDKQMEAVSGGLVYPCVEGPKRPGWKPNLLCPLNLVGPTDKE